MNSIRVWPRGYVMRSVVPKPTLDSSSPCGVSNRSMARKKSVQNVYMVYGPGFKFHLVLRPFLGYLFHPLRFQKWSRMLNQILRIAEQLCKDRLQNYSHCLTVYQIDFLLNSSQNAEEIGVSKPWKQNPPVELSLAFVTRRSNYDN
jgi:hypothetical protein